MQSDFITEVKRIVDRLSELDKRRVVFGAQKHKYRFQKPLPEDAVSEFEQRYELTLPVPYRRFLTELGNGGVGPFYGIEPLRLEDSDLLSPFPGTEEFEYEDEGGLPGAIYLVEYGCGIEIVLVAKGESAGEVWWDARYEGGVAPMLIGNKDRATFDTFWLSDMQEQLNEFETIWELMRNTTDHEEIHQMLDKKILQLHIDQIMLSLMDQDPQQTPSHYKDKPWGGPCGLVDDHYPKWCEEWRKKR